MVTIVDPNGTPTPIYTRSGTTFETVAGNGTTQGAATQIVSVAGWTVVLVTMTNDPDNRAVKLPENAPIGDVVEVYANGAEGSAATVFAASGDTLFNSGTGSPAFVSVTRNTGGTLFRKVTATEWRFIGAS